MFFWILNAPRNPIRLCYYQSYFPIVIYIVNCLFSGPIDTKRGKNEQDRSLEWVEGVQNKLGCVGKC